MKRLRGLAITAAVAAGLTACTDSLGPADTERGGDPAARVAQYRQVWNAAGVKSYRMKVRVHGAWVGGSAVIEVRNGTPVSVKPIEHAGVVGQALAFETVDTVEELFAMIERAIERQAERLDVNFNRRYGFPLSAAIDVRFHWADDEHGFAVEDFQVLR